MKKRWNNFIGGSWSANADSDQIEITDPATGHVIASCDAADAEDIDRAVVAARQCVTDRHLSGMAPAERGKLMRRIAQEIRAAKDEIAACLCHETGKKLSECNGEVIGSASYFDYFAGLSDKLEGRFIPVGSGVIDYTTLVPYGVSVQIVPWNYPIGIGCRSLAAAMVTGNASVVKSPELAPLALCLIAEAFERAKAPKGSLSVLCGKGSKTGALLTQHRDIDHLVFTGSRGTGAQVLHALADRAVPAIMELGGKSAGVVMTDADMDAVRKTIRSAPFKNSGQNCSAMTRLIVHNSRLEEVTEQVHEILSNFSVGPGKDECDITPLISEAQRQRVSTYCDNAREAGAEVIFGGKVDDQSGGHFFQPTAFGGVTPEMQINQEEVFGPVLAILSFDEPEEAVALSNGTEYGLAAGVFTQDFNMAHWMTDHLEAGAVFVNDWSLGGVAAPSGGMKRSGYGRERGQDAILGYTQIKNVGMRFNRGPV